MTSTVVNVRKECIHMRPATILCEIANLFPDHQIALVSASKSFPADSMLGWNLDCMDMDNPFTLTVTGTELHDEGVAQLALDIMKVCIDNLILIRDAIALGDKSETPFVLFQELYSLINQAVTENQSNEKPRVLLGVQKVFGLLKEQRRYKTRAVLNSQKGMHVFPSKLLASISSLLKSKTVLNFVSSEGEPDSADASTPWSLLSASIPNGTRIIVKTEGIDSEEAGRVVKYILENIDPVIHPWVSQNGSVDTTEDARRLLAYVRARLEEGVRTDI